MAQDIAGKRESLPLPLSNLTATGLILDENTTESEADEIGRFVAKAGVATQWWIGDYWNFRQRKTWGVGQEAAERLGLEYDTAKVYASICAAYPELLMRINKLSFYHHRVVAFVHEPLRSELLRWAVETGASARDLKRRAKELLAGEPEPLPDDVYAVLYADPPWKYNDERMVDGYEGTAAGHHYPTMATEDICNLPIDELAIPESCVLMCWATFPLLPDALEVVRAWGFTYKTAIVWDKMRPNMGNYHDASAELLLIATRGSAVPELRPKQIQAIKREGRHSEKPAHFRELVDAMYPAGRRIELFRRGDAPDGWHIWGNEADV